jgi:dihydroneopterin aldolase
MDEIRLTGLRATGHHGVFEHERENGQVFVIDVTVRLPLAPAAAEDELDRTVHYGVLAEAVVAAVERDPVDLIETVAERVADVALSFDAVREVAFVRDADQIGLRLEDADDFSSRREKRGDARAHGARRLLPYSASKNA